MVNSTKEYRKYVSACGRAAAARSALSQMGHKDKGDRYNPKTISVIQPDGTFRSWASDAYEMEIRNSPEYKKMVKVQAKAIWAREIYERALADQQLKIEAKKARMARGSPAQRFGNAAYNTANKTIEVAGKVIGPVYREAVRPMVSALWTAGKEAIKGLWNTGAGAAQVVYESGAQRRNGRQNPSSAQSQTEIPQQPERDEPNYDGQILGPGMDVEGRMYGENLEQKADSAETVHAENRASRTATESRRGYIGRLVNRIKNKAYELQHGIVRGSGRKSIDERISAPLNCSVITNTPIVESTDYTGQVRDSPDDKRNKIPESRAHDDREFLEQGSESKNPSTENSNNLLRDYITVTGYETQKKINAPFIARRKEREMRDNCSRLSKQLGGDDENMKVAEILRYFHNQP